MIICDWVGRIHTYLWRPGAYVSILFSLGEYSARDRISLGHKELEDSPFGFGFGLDKTHNTKCRKTRDIPYLYQVHISLNSFLSDLIRFKFLNSIHTSKPSRKFEYDIFKGFQSKLEHFF